jgi:hypothetical protein
MEDKDWCDDCEMYVWNCGCDELDHDWPDDDDYDSDLETNYLEELDYGDEESCVNDD